MGASFLRRGREETCPLPQCWTRLSGHPSLDLSPVEQGLRSLWEAVFAEHLLRH